MEGRDIGTVVLPKADVKIFLTADAKVRAKRRYDQLKEKDENVQFEKVLNEIINRDYNDENRKIAPLKCAKDAFIVDCSQLSIQETTQKCMEIITKKLNLE